MVTECPETKAEGTATPDCLECGACCKVLLIDLRGGSHEDRDFLVRRGCRFVAGRVAVPTRCPHLESLGGCNCYSRRPVSCSLFVRGGGDCLLARIAVREIEQQQ